MHSFSSLLADVFQARDVAGVCTQPALSSVYQIEVFRRRDSCDMLMWKRKEGREPYGVQYTSSTSLSHEGLYLFQSNSLCILSDFVNAAAFCFICSLQTGCRNHFVDREDVEESLEWHFKRCPMDICWDAKWCFPLVSRPPVKKVVRPYQVRVYHIRKKKSYSGGIFETRLSWESGADPGGGCRGCAPPLPWDDLRPLSN